MRDIFWVDKISTISLGVLEIPDMFLGVNGRCRARTYVWRKNESTPPPPPVYAHCSMAIARTWFMFNNVFKNCLCHVPTHRKIRLDKTITTQTWILFHICTCHKRAKTAKHDVGKTLKWIYTALSRVHLYICHYSEGDTFLFKFGKKSYTEIIVCVYRRYMYFTPIGTLKSVVYSI